MTSRTYEAHDKTDSPDVYQAQIREERGGGFGEEDESESEFEWMGERECVCVCGVGWGGGVTAKTTLGWPTHQTLSERTIRDYNLI